MMAPGLVNLDFADIRTVMAEMGKAMMGTGEADGENRAIRAAEAAISNPLLEDTSMNGARGLLINITGGDDLTLFEVDQAANRIREEVDEEANIIFGSAIDPELQGRIRVSVVATGIDSPAQIEREKPRLVASGGGAMPQPIPLPLHGMTLSGSAPVLTLHQSRPPAPQALGMAEAMPENSMMEAMQTAAHPPAPPPVTAEASHAPRSAPAAPRSGLFAEASRPVSAEPAAEAARPSLFSTVTGAFRWRQHHAPAATTEPAPVRADPAPQVARTEPPRVSVRQTAGDEVGLDIPAFLRRQSS
jgi:cell division protein FtsZ